MRKEMIKFNSDWNSKYQIATIIYKKDGIKRVRKEPLTEAAVEHIDRIIQNYEILKKVYMNCGICTVERTSEGIEFDYVEGDALASYYRKAINNNNKEDFLTLVKQHADIIIEKKENICTFHSSPEFEMYFGDGSVYEGKKGLSCANFEATAQNIILKDDFPTFIDYEWVFPFPIPLDLILYHCIIRINEFFLLKEDGFVNKEELFRILDIESKEEQLEKNWRHFWDFLCEEEKHNYLNIKGSQYQKEIFDIRSTIDENVRLRGVDEYNKYLLAEKEKQQQCIEELNQGLLGQNEYVNNLEKNIREQNRYIQVLSGTDEYNKRLVEEREQQQKCIQELNRGIEAQNEYVNSLEGNIKEQNCYIQSLLYDKNQQQEYIEYCEQQRKELLVEKDELEQENNVNIQKVSELKKLIDRQQEHLREQAVFINKVKGSLLGKMFFRA